MILFRCNAGPSVGFGHIVRCRCLAAALKDLGESCVMVGPSKDYETPEDKKVFSDWIPQSSWKSAIEDARLFLQIASHFSAKMAVLDDYRIEEDYQLLLRNAGLHWLQFDGSVGKPLWADIVLNTRPGVKDTDYKPVLRTPAELLLGPRYAILRQEFVEQGYRPQNHIQKRVLVTFGGGDDRGANLFVLKNLVNATPTQIQFVVISGVSNPRNAEIEKWIKDNDLKKVHLKINPPSVASIMASCDFAIMAGGTTTYEAVCCGLPMILIAIADNQVRHSLAWEKITNAHYLGMLGEIENKRLVDTFNEFNDPALLDTCRDAIGRRIVDGYGGNRVAKQIVKKIDSLK
jgi:UDP-2,4-diacetamido-2,4,6-trideoxy-beta-L-altropyranose hydrolase